MGDICRAYFVQTGLTLKHLPVDVPALRLNALQCRHAAEANWMIGAEVG
jgi:hypothetical protein